MRLTLFFSILIFLFNFLNPATPAIRLAILISIYVLTSFYFISLDFYFLGLTYIIVYVGAIAILFLFVIMLLNQSLLPLNSIQPQIRPIGSYEPKELGEIPDLLILSESESKMGGDSANLRLVKDSRLAPFGLLIVLAAIPVILFLVDSEGSLAIYNLFLIDWSSDFASLTDLMILGYHLFLGYPLVILLIGILLWILLIGILNLL